MFEPLIKTFITLFVIIDPVAVVPLYIKLTHGASLEYKKKVALKSTIIATIILLSFAWIGETLLDSLGISNGALSIAGGLLLLITAMDMVLVKDTGIRSTTSDENEEADKRDDVSVFPLAIPMISGPGALTSVIIQMKNAGGHFWAEMGIVLVIIIVLLITYYSMRAATFLSRLLGVTGTNVVTRVFGIILAALSIQLMISGLQQCFSWGH